MREYNIEKYNLTEVDIIIARKIRQRRIELGLTQQEVADKLGVTRGNVTHFEAGRNKISHNILKNLADILHKPVSYFISEDETYMEEMAIKSNPEEIKKIADSWKMKNYLVNKKVPGAFIDDLELTIEYLCELYGVKLEDIW